MTKRQWQLFLYEVYFSMVQEGHVFFTGRIPDDFRGDFDEQYAFMEQCLAEHLK